MRSIIIVVALLFLYKKSTSQDIGGVYAFEYLRLSQSPHTSALGGFVVVHPANDISLAFSNPAILTPKHHTNIAISNNVFYGRTIVNTMMYAHHIPKLHTTFAIGITNLNYGTFRITDNIGNVIGNGHASDYSIHVLASKKYLEKWQYGVDVKFASSRLIDNSAKAVVVDAGITYMDTIKKVYFGAVVKNAGIQIKKYNTNNDSEPLPFDMQVGIVKQFKKAPFRISALVHHLYDWDIRYNNPADKLNNQLLIIDTTQEVKTKKYTADKLFRHFVFAVELSLGKRLEATFGYNHLRRGELSLAEKKGLAGYSMGVGMYLNKFTIHYARNYYHIAGAYNEIGINMKLNQIVGLGNLANKIHWAEKF